MLIPRCIALLFLINYAQSFNILGIFPHEGRSHFFVFRVLLRELAERGHNVTVLSQFPEKNPPANYHDVTIKSEPKKMTMPVEPRTYKQLVGIIQILDKLATGDCERMLSNEKIQELVKSKQSFDVILVEKFNTDCGLAVAYKLGAPVVAINSHVMMPWHYTRLGISSHPAYIRNHFLEGGTKPSLYQRVERLLLDTYYKMYYNYVIEPRAETVVKKYLGEVPPLAELANQVKVTLLYHHFVMTGSQPLPSNAIEIGGLHVTKPEPVTGDLKTFMDGAEHGVVYISFGSLADSSTLAVEKQKAIIEAMNEFPHRFVWKWDSNNFNLDKKKVYISNWLPQKDILAHPKTKAFMSHGGMLGTSEAFTFGVPIVVMPVFGDQPANADAIEESGFGVQIQIQDMTKENIVAAFKKVLDKGFYDNVKSISKAWNDRPQSALDTAVFWTEYVARNPQVNYRSPAADVPLYQYLYLDVILVLISIIAIPLLVIRNAFKSSKPVVKVKKQ